MADFHPPRLARLQEFDEAMAFTDRVFRPAQRGRRILQRQYPHAYRETPAYARRLLLLRDADAADAIVGCLAMHPLQIRLGAATISAGGIGIVGTHPQRRGEGIMTRLLDDALARMRVAGHAISVLGGDRQRYGWFGWENGGVRYRYLITRRMLGPPTRMERRLRLLRFDAEDAGLRRRVHALLQARAFGVEHKPAEVAPLLCRDGHDTWVVRESRRFACLCLGGAQRRKRPYEHVAAALGDQELVASALRLLMARQRLTQLWAVAGPDPEEAALFEPWSAQWTVEDDGMIRILDLPRLVAQLQPEIRRRRRMAGVNAPDLTLSLTDLQQSACLPGGGGGRSRCRLTAARAVQLLFGSRSLAATGLAGRLPAKVLGPWGAILPLPLHLPPLDHI